MEVQCYVSCLSLFCQPFLARQNSECELLQFSFLG
nr:MAG TPA: hypothetical protein [Caudoviricetes sp.]